jgi:hypothetical protein
MEITNMEKFIDEIDINDYEILTDSGWSNVSKIYKTIPFQKYIIYAGDFELTAADTHIVFDENYNEVFIKDLTVGDNIITQQGPAEVSKIIITNEEANMYDVTVNNNNHRYFTNGILSHNTAAYCAAALWLTIFNKNYNILICGTNQDSANDFVSDIKMAIEELPLWLKPGIEVWNVKKLEFTNGSSIRASPVSPGIRGKSLNCLTGDTEITIKDTVTDLICDCTLEELEEFLTNEKLTIEVE